MISVYRTNNHYMVEVKAKPCTYIIDVRYYKSNPCSFLSPYTKWGDVPIRFSAPDTAISIAAMIEGLRVNTCNETNQNLFHSSNFTDLVKPERIENSIGFLRGIGGHVILSAEEAQKELLYPTYKWVLNHKLQKYIINFREVAKSHNIIILDYPKNKQGMEIYTGDISIGQLLKAYIEGTTPYEEVFEEKTESTFITNYKRISGYKATVTTVPREIITLPDFKNRQLIIPFE